MSDMDNDETFFHNSVTGQLEEVHKMNWADTALCLVPRLLSGKNIDMGVGLSTTELIALRNMLQKRLAMREYDAAGQEVDLNGLRVLYTLINSMTLWSLKNAKKVCP